MNNDSLKNILVFALLLSVFLLIGTFVIPWQTVNWGKVALLPGNVVTVVGEAKSQQKSQVAIFSAGVSAVNDNKDMAISDVNKKIQTIIDAIKTFGIPTEDIKTQTLSVYQNEDIYYEEGKQKTRLGQWRVNNTIEIKLKNVDKASELTDLLTKSGANNVYGPNFMLDDTKSVEKSLLEEAIKNAQEKASVIAKSSGRKLGRIISVTEGAQSTGILRSFEGFGAGGGGASPVEPGSSTVQKLVTVTFELK